MTAAVDVGVERARCIPPLTARQTRIAELLSDGYTPGEIARGLCIAEITVRYHIEQAARRIAGDLPPRSRVVMWWRGATREMLLGPPGASLRLAIYAVRKSL